MKNELALMIGDPAFLVRETGFRRTGIRLAQRDEPAAPAPARVGHIGERPEHHRPIRQQIARMFAERRQRNDLDAAGSHDAQAPRRESERLSPDVLGPVRDGHASGVWHRGQW